MEFFVFVAYLIMTVLVISGAWVPSVLTIKVYLVVVTICMLINMGSKSS